MFCDVNISFSKFIMQIFQRSCCASDGFYTVSLEIGSLSYFATELSHFRDLKTGGPKIERKVSAPSPLPHDSRPVP